MDVISSFAMDALAATAFVFALTNLVKQVVICMSKTPDARTTQGFVVVIVFGICAPIVLLPLATAHDHEHDKYVLAARIILALIIVIVCIYIMSFHTPPTPPSMTPRRISQAWDDERRAIFIAAFETARNSIRLAFAVAEVAVFFGSISALYAWLIGVIYLVWEGYSNFQRDWAIHILKQPNAVHVYAEHLIQPRVIEGWFYDDVTITMTLTVTVNSRLQSHTERFEHAISKSVFRSGRPHPATIRELREMMPVVVQQERARIESNAKQILRIQN